MYRRKTATTEAERDEDIGLYVICGGGNPTYLQLRAHNLTHGESSPGTQLAALGSAVAKLDRVTRMLPFIGCPVTGRGHPCPALTELPVSDPVPDFRSVL